jgi:Ca2+-binding RTX toxin-like protein
MVITAAALTSADADFTFTAADTESKGAYTVTGGSGDDTITTNIGIDTITGGAGADTIVAGGADDVIVVGTGHDAAAESYTGGAGTGDTLQMDAGADLSDDTLATIEILDLHEDGTAVAITMSDAQLDGFTTIKSAASAIGTGDKITMSAVMTADMLDGTTIGAGTDADEVIIILADVASNALTVHNDTLAQAADKLFIDGTGLTGTNALTFNGAAEATAAVLTVSGGAAVDTIIGGAGADVLKGGAGADNITGGAGIDTLSGEAGADKFIMTGVKTAAAANNIADFLGDGTGQDLFHFANADLTGIGGAAAAATANTAFHSAQLTDSASATIDAAIDNATGTTTGQQIVILGGGSAGGTMTAAELEAGLTASDLTGAGYLIVGDSATAARVFYDTNFASGTDGTGLALVSTVTGTVLLGMSLDSHAII